MLLRNVPGWVWVQGQLWVLGPVCQRLLELLLQWLELLLVQRRLGLFRTLPVAMQHLRLQVHLQQRLLLGVYVD